MYLTLLTLCVVALSLASIVAALYIGYLWYRQKTRNTSNAVTPQWTAANDRDRPIMPYTEYKKKYGSRVREIAILAINKSTLTQDVIKEFTNTMRERGGKIYHFTHYYGNGSAKSVQKMMAEILQGHYHLTLTIGHAATQAAKHITTSRHAPMPIVFALVRDEWWKKEQEKLPVEHMSGILMAGQWQRTLLLFLEAKPDMKSVLVTGSTNYPIPFDREIINSFFESNRITLEYTHPSNTTDLMQTLRHYLGKIDSIIITQDTYSPQIVHAIGAFCTEHGITLFSVSPEDINQGVVVTVSPRKMHHGQRAATKALALLEEDKEPSDLGHNTASTQQPYFMSFNHKLVHKQNISLDRLQAIAEERGILLELHFEEDET
jgi:ABC-type uncharacterized transport system substrate-binding protein